MSGTETEGRVRGWNVDKLGCRGKRRDVPASQAGDPTVGVLTEIGLCDGTEKPDENGLPRTVFGCLKVMEFSLPIAARCIVSMSTDGVAGAGRGATA